MHYPKNKELIVRIRIFTLLSFIMNVIINCKTQKKIPMIFSKYFAKIIFKGQDLLLQSIQIACIFKLRLIHYTFFSLFPSFRNLNLMLICYSPNAHFTNFEDACDTSLCYHYLLLCYYYYIYYCTFIHSNLIPSQHCSSIFSLW